ARGNLGLGDSATLNVGNSVGTVAAGDHGHTAANISDFNDAVAAAPAVSANSAKNSYPSGDATKVGYLTVTGATDLDAIRTKAGHISVSQAVDLDAIESTVASNASAISGLGDLATKDSVGSEEIT